ncbi:hypothetical protein HYU22_00650 [Candidatus Woesearchaeota archaeon]|nr:hypothetical protein [Candidatus Woesearchaeota archaeon]
MKINYHLLALITLAISYGFLTSTELGTASQAQNIPTVFHIMNPDYLSNDWYIKETSGFDARYFYNQLIIIINYIFRNLEWTVLFLHSLSFALFIGGLYYLIKTILKEKNKTFFTTAIFFVGYPIVLGGISFFKSSLSANGLASALLVIAIYFYFREKYIYSFTILGLVTLIDVGEGIPIAGLFIGGLLLSKPLFSKEKAISLLQSAPYFIISLLLIIPLYLSNIDSTPTLAIAAAKIYANFHVTHTLPSSWGMTIILPFILFVILFIFILKRTNYEYKHKRIIRNFSWIILLYIIIGVVFVEIYPIATITKMVIFRATKIIALLGYLTLGAYLFDRLEKSRNWLEKKYLIMVPIFFIYPLLAILAIPLFLLIEYYQEKKEMDVFDLFLRKKNTIIPITILLTGAGIFLVYNYLLFLLPRERMALNAVLPFVIIPIMFYFILMYTLTAKERIIAIIVIIISLATAIIGPFNPHLHIPTHDPETNEMLDYLKINSPPDAVFLTPFDLSGFRTTANRSIVVDHLHPFTDKGMARWFLRIRDISNHQITTFSQLKEYYLILQGYDSLQENDLERLNRKYNISYALFKKPKELNLSLFYENEKYIVYKVPLTRDER